MIARNSRIQGQVDNVEWEGESPLRGLIIRSQSGFYTVQVKEKYYTCRLRGRLKRGPRIGDVAAIGDWVQLTPIKDDQGVIEVIEPRVRMLSRQAPTPRGTYQQIIIANPDQVVFVFACARPEPRFGMLDRYLVIAEKQGVPPIIVANKVDLVGKVRARQLFEHYAAIGYTLLYTSAETGAGISDLRKQLAGSISALTGPSGAGKSSLLNAIQPELGLQVRTVSRGTRKGRHTTVVRELYPLEGGGFVADTPGLKALALWDIEPEELDGYFPEIRTLVADCQFSDCTHLHEPGCAVQRAVTNGTIHPARYESYVRIRQGQEDDSANW